VKRTIFVQTLLAFDTPDCCAADAGCTTDALDTHKTETRRVLYRWHPLYERELIICGRCNRHGAVMFICKSDDGALAAPLEVPAWMFDSAECCRLTAAPCARVDVPALFALQALLRQVGARTDDVVEAQQHFTTSGGFDAHQPQCIPNSADHVLGESCDTALASECQLEAPHPSRQAPARGRTPARSGR
jgi:hypothetical protein